LKRRKRKTTDLYNKTWNAINEILITGHQKFIESVNTALDNTDFKIIKPGSLSVIPADGFYLELEGVKISNGNLLLTIENCNVETDIKIDYYTRDLNRLHGYKERHGKPLLSPLHELSRIYLYSLGFAKFNSLKDIEYNLLNFLRVCLGHDRIKDRAILGCDRCVELELYKYCIPYAECEVQTQCLNSTASSI
jgi:uncharacterized C2H2 Zn-finger protein